MDQEPVQKIIDPAGWLREQRRRTATLLERAERASAELDESSVTTTSRDQTVTVTVNPGGMLLDLRLTPAAQNLSPNQLSARIMRTYQSACSQAAALTVDIMSELVGEDSPALDFLMQALPPLEDDGPHDEDTYDDSHGERGPAADADADAHAGPGSRSESDSGTERDR